jgi:hypothetical protein
MVIGEGEGRRGVRARVMEMMETAEAANTST